MKLLLKYPISPIRITQRFGETANLAYYRANGLNFKGHNGIDMLASHGQPIYAAHDGIAYYEIDGSQGHGVVVRTNDVFDYQGQQAYFKTIYWHMVDSAKEPKFTSPIEPFISIFGPGKSVKAGDLLGYANTTGLSTGDHLHFGLKPVIIGEPAGTWANMYPDNGYMGAIDPAPYLDKHIFNIDINYGDVSDEVKALQDALIRNGFMFPVASADYGTYGPRTAAAVKLVQSYFKVASAVVLWWNGGKYIGPATRTALNALP